MDSSLLVPAYLEDEGGHRQARAFLTDSDHVAVTGAWSVVEVSGALVRAARAGRIAAEGLLKLLDEEFERLVTLVRADPEQVERLSLELVRMHGLRALDAWHLATAQLTVPELAAHGEPVAFATRNEEQGAVAESLGFVRV